MKTIRRRAKASAPAKIILFGEHFVLYNNPAILASINKYIVVSVHLNKTRSINIISDLGIIASYKASRFYLAAGVKNSKTILDPVYKSALSVLSEREQDLGLDIQLLSEIPYGVGLGSSAACCVATVAAVDSLFHKANKQWVCARAVESERLVHKYSSGSDCYVSTFGGLIYYIKDKGFNRIISKGDLSLIIVNTEDRHSTGSLVSTVKKFRDENKSLFNDLAYCAKSICQSAYSAIEIGDDKKLGRLMNENQSLLRKIGVSNKKIDRLVDVCIQNGALGAKITGAGGGGSIVALVPKKKKLKIMLEIDKIYRCNFTSVKIDHDGLVAY